MFRAYTVLLALVVFVGGYPQSDTYKFRHLSTAEGLSQSSAIAIHQDQLGQMWIGTRDGLNRYNGNTFTVFRNIPDDSTSISNNDILSIEEDSDGFIWVGTYNGLNRFDPKKNTFTTYFHNNGEASLSNNTIWTIKEMSNGEIWIGTSMGLSIFRKDSSDFISIFQSETDSGLAGNHIYSILETKDEEVYVGTTSGLSQLTGRDGKKPIFRPIDFSWKHSGDEYSPYIQDILEGSDGHLLVATRNHGILLYDQTTQAWRPYFEEARSDREINVRKLIYDNEGTLWVGTYNGLQVVTPDRQVTSLVNQISDPKSLSKNSIKTLYKDRKGSIWVGTYYGGVNIWDESNVNFINFSQTYGNKGLSYDVVSSIAHRNGVLFFGTEGGGITILDTKDQTTTYIDQQNTSALPDNNIKSLYLADGGHLWIGTFNNGLAVYDIDRDTFDGTKISAELATFLDDVGVYNVKRDNNGALWIGTFGKGLVKYNETTGTLIIYRHRSSDKNSLSSDLVRAINIDAQNNIWIGTERGLNLMDSSGSIRHYFYNSQVQSGDDISTIFEDSSKQIWVGTKAKGLYRFDGVKFNHVKLRDAGQMVSAVHSILEDHNGQLWISTNQGLIRYDPKDENSTVYNQKEGLVSNEFNDNASLKVGDSQFYFGGPAGVTSFDSKNLATNDYSPQVIITDFKIRNESLDPQGENSVSQNTIQYTDALELSYEQGNFTISFAIPSFINSSSNRYQYRLKGLDEDWVTTSQNSASYTIQNSGEYIFEVRGANNDGVWNESPTQLSILVNPAPWRSWWAFLIYGLLILAALYFLMSILKSKTKLKHQLDLEHIETERTKEVNKAKLEFFTNISHEFRTPLTLILGPLHQILDNYKGSSKMYKKLKVIESSANHLLQLINRLMDFRKLENNLFKLEAAEGNIVKFLREIYLSFSEYAKDGDYDYSFHTTEDQILVYYDRYKLERVFYNLISNAFRYTPKGGRIAVRIRLEKDEIIIQVDDSGVGIAEEYRDKIFERFFEVSVNNNPDHNYNKGTGIGLSIAKNIVNLHKGRIWVKPNDDGKGSIFSVALPLGSGHLKEEEIIEDFKFSDDVSQYVDQLKEPSLTMEEEDLTDQIKSNDKATVLLVEDNKPLRSFMRSILKNDYNILEAENGKVALRIAQKESPDLIVSDVIMPVMVGTELCSAIKQDIKTSHIPIILLTARTSLIYKLEGLESGADDYISKPFNVEEFKARIKNLIKSTSRIKNKYSSEDSWLPSEVIVSSLDEKLLKKALEIVEENISNEQFDIPHFCSELGVSRTMLFIKIKAWTDFTPNEFIQHFRMKRAAQLLEQGKINISEVSYKVGFKNPKYFSKCFQKKFGETPTQYANRFSID
ncbi:two-component regulator propeller domain-containing protein [Sungkyunkwania multivorans]|uniref:histidine kinase n=1 Tax=Sungkyunkwania multivorans TaxID=1173618 RepID=A0ABW3CYA8_9FLAO